MGYFKELFEIIGLLISIGTLEAAKLKDQYLRTLRMTAFIAIILPVLLVIPGFIFKNDLFFGIAGIVSCIAMAIILFGFYPFVLLLQGLLSLRHKQQDVIKRSLARRYLNVVLTILLAECLITFYAMLFPLETRPSMIVTLILCFIVLTILSIRWVRVVGVIVRLLSVLIVITVLLASTLTLVFPKSMDAIRGIVPAVDEKWEQGIKKIIEGVRYPDSTSIKKVVVVNKGEAVKKNKEKNFFNNFLSLFKTARPWREYTVKADIADAMPTYIHVEPGDTVEFNAGGKIECRIERKQHGSWYDSWDEIYKIKSGPEGIWPPWMTYDTYSKQFKETASNKCWNLTMQLGAAGNEALRYIGSEYLWIADKAGDIWLNINKMSPWDYNWRMLYNGEYNVEILLTPASDSARATLKMASADSSRQTINLEDTFGTYEVFADAVGAVPTYIKVNQGDTIDFVASGGVFYILTPWSGEKRVIRSGPEGIWPSWMTYDFYMSYFTEKTSLKCWNLVFKIGPKSNTLYHVGEKSRWIVPQSGDIWLTINGTSGISWRAISGSGSFKVKIHTSRVVSYHPGRA